jgi:hypothetical protein
MRMREGLSGERCSHSRDGTALWSNPFAVLADREVLTHEIESRCVCI